MLSKQFISTYE